MLLQHRFRAAPLRRALSFVSCLLAVTSARAEVRLGEKCVVEFAGVDQARAVLTAQDDYVVRLSPFDRAARLKTDRDVPTDEYLQFVGGTVQAWSASETARLQVIVAELAEPLAEFANALPPKVRLIKTTGAEEGGAAYTRGNAIVLPQARLAAGDHALKKLFCHELFHVISRRNGPLREALYAAVGFQPCEELELPPDLARRKITNPDAPRNDHCIRLRVDGTPTWAVPVLLSRSETYDVRRGGEFFDHMEFRLLLVERAEGSAQLRPLWNGGKPRLVEVKQTAEFYEQVGKNTRYIIHPEEILADNFALLVLEAGELPSPEILAKMRAIFATPPHK